MKTKTSEPKPKKGTIGYAVAKLVKRYAHYPAGLTILEMALQKATGADCVRYDIPGNGLCASPVFLSQTPGYKAASLEEAKSFGRLGIVWYNTELSLAKKYTPSGTVVAVRFVPGSTESEMRQCIENDYTKTCNWEPYNESTNTFAS